MRTVKRETLCRVNLEWEEERRNATMPFQQDQEEMSHERLNRRYKVLSVLQPEG